MTSRRTFLTTVGAAAGAALAGCIATPNPSIESRAFTAGNTTCVDEQTNEGTLEADGSGGITFSGTIPENDPEYEATVSYGFNEQTLVIRVGTSRDTASPVQCTAEVPYEGRVEVSNTKAIELKHKGTTVDTYDVETGN